MKTGKRSWYSLSVLLYGILLIAGCSNRQKTELPVINTESATVPEDYRQQDTVFFYRDYGNFSIAVSETIYSEYCPDYYCRDGSLVVKNRKGTRYFKQTEDFYPYWDNGVFETGLPGYFYMDEYNTGNCSLCGAWFVLKITADTAFILGMVNGYDDIDSNGTREFFYNEASWVHGQSHAQMDV